MINRWFLREVLYILDESELLQSDSIVRFLWAV